jgi:hypothetical protein
MASLGRPSLRAAGVEAGAQDVGQTLQVPVPPGPHESLFL